MEGPMSNILIVEDHKHMARMLSYMIMANGHQAEVVSNGQEALQKLNDTAVDLLITDMYMPKMTGLSLVQQVRKTNANKKLPVIMLTVSGDEGTRQLAHQSGTDCFLRKPVRIADLHHAVDALLEGGIG